MAVLPMLAVVGATGGAHIRFWGFLIVGLPWPAGVRWMLRTVLCLDPRRYGQRSEVLFKP